MQRGQKPKPIHRYRIGIISRPNIPFDRPLTPGLNRPISTSAIGFTHDIMHISLSAEDAQELGPRRKRD